MKPMRSALVGLAALVFTVSAQTAGPKPVKRAPAPTSQKPSLIVVLAVDQMRADYLERFRPYFGKDGFNRFLERGAWFTQARHRHAITYTGPGHAVIGTG